MQEDAHVHLNNAMNPLELSLGYFYQYDTSLSFRAEKTGVLGK
jgi:hypothetical protein